MGARGALRKKRRAIKSFGKGIAKVVEKVGPLASAVLGLIAKILDYDAKGALFL